MYAVFSQNIIDYFAHLDIGIKKAVSSILKVIPFLIYFYIIIMAYALPFYMIHIHPLISLCSLFSRILFMLLFFFPLSLIKI